MVGGGSFNEEPDCADTESLIFIAVYYVQSAWTLQHNLLEDNRNILSIRHWLGPVGPSGWQIILKSSQPNCRRKACNVLHAMDRAIWGLNLPTLYSPSASTNNPSGVRFLWLWGFCSDRWALNIVGIYLPPPDQFPQTPGNRLPYSVSNLQYNEFVLFWFSLGTKAPACLLVVLFTPPSFSFL